MDMSAHIDIFKILVLISFLSSQSEGAERKFSRGFLNNMHYLDLPEKATNVTLPEAEWFDQRLDHFNAQDTTIWRQRYFSNFSFYKTGGPVFIIIGGEAAVSPSYVVSKFECIEWAKKHNAALFTLEHRFYGQSHPKPDLSTENLQWLSSRQGLNDLANFIEAMTEKHNFTGPWIAFGGSYSGSMAAWLRQKFPHLISGAISSSGPLEAKVNFFDYLQVVHDAFEEDGPECNIEWKKAITEIESVIDGPPHRWKEFGDLFKLCDPFDGTKKEDVARFVAGLIGIAMGAAQYNVNAIPYGLMDISSVCKNITDKRNGKTALERLANLKARLLGGRPCWHHKYQDMVNEILNTEYHDIGPGVRQWTYQKCSEFGWYKTSDQPKHPYGSKIPLDFLLKICSDVFGESFKGRYIEKIVENSNSYYGAKDLDVENVVFVHGSIDPWHAMGRTTDLNKDAPAIMIKGAAHCADMNPHNENDPPQLVEARERIGKLLDKWIHEANFEK